jgi:hypothetical protein
MKASTAASTGRTHQDRGLIKDPIDQAPPFQQKVIRLCVQMLREEAQAARPSDIGACLVVAGPLVAMEAVLGTGIGEDLDFWLRAAAR